jgi:hypothetical protein
MVAAGSLFLLCLSASSHHRRHHGSSKDVRRHAAPSLVVKPSTSSLSSGPRREDRKKSFLSAPSDDVEGQVNDGGAILQTEARDLPWGSLFFLLKQFQKREGHSNVPRSHQEDGSNLGNWVHRQRRLKTTGKLDPDRQTMLEDMGFEWAIFVPWEETFPLLKQFQMREGHSNVPPLHKEDGVNLGNWVSHQRQLKRKETLDFDRQQMLEDIGFEWVLLKGRATVPWEGIFSLLKQFQKREGHCNVPTSHKEDGVNLGNWVSHQRQLIRKETLDSGRQQMLEDIAFEWVPLKGRATAPWQEIFSLLKQFQKREGHCNVPTSQKEDGSNLGSWVSLQRQLKRKETLDSGRQQMLEDIGFEWATSPTWGEMYALLQQFQRREGHCNIPQSHQEGGSNLGVWVHSQRRLKTTGKLDPDRQTMLEDMGFEWAIFVPWEETFPLLKQFQMREGHSNVPPLHKEDGVNLGNWVSHQRQLKRKETLDFDRQQMLEDIGFEWVLLKGRATVPWEGIFSLLKQFQKREGHCNVPTSHKEDGVNLGNWVSHQRQLIRKETLDSGRQHMLEDIAFEWVPLKGRATAPWEEIFSLLKQFQKREGHCNVPLSRKEDGVNLGNWVNHQRQLKRKETLNSGRQKMLEGIGFEWATSPTWDEMYALLIQFQKREGHSNVPRSHKEDGTALGAWKNRQHQLQKTGKLDLDRQTRLEEVGLE